MVLFDRANGLVQDEYSLSWKRWEAPNRRTVYRNNNRSLLGLLGQCYWEPCCEPMDEGVMAPRKDECRTAEPRANRVHAFWRLTAWGQHEGKVLRHWVWNEKLDRAQQSETEISKWALYWYNQGMENSNISLKIIMRPCIGGTCL